MSWRDRPDFDEVHEREVLGSHEPDSQRREEDVHVLRIDRHRGVEGQHDRIKRRREKNVRTPQKDLVRLHIFCEKVNLSKHSVSWKHGFVRMVRME